MLLNSVLSISPPQAENFDVFGTFLDGFPLIFLPKSEIFWYEIFLRFHVPKDFRKCHEIALFSDFTYLRIFEKSTFLRFHVPKENEISFVIFKKKTLVSVCRRCLSAWRTPVHLENLFEILKLGRQEVNRKCKNSPVRVRDLHLSVARAG